MIPGDSEILVAAPEQQLPPPRPARSHAVPHLGHTALFGLLVLITLLLTMVVFSLLVPHIAAFRHEGFAQLQTDPRAVIPEEGIWYAFAVVVAWGVFHLLWRRPLLQALRWNPAQVRRYLLRLAGTGAVLSIAVQLLSNFLPIPKELPIDKFFQNSFGIWLVAIFGVTVAPFFEELAFRGFLLPSLANAWDRTTGRAAGRPLAFTAEITDSLPIGDLPDAESTPVLDGDPPWSMPAMVVSSIVTSMGFALLHSAQLAHAYAPLAVLFCVSMVLCFIRLRTHSFAASAFVHACYNGTIFLLLFYGTDGFRHLDKLSR